MENAGVPYIQRMQVIISRAFYAHHMQNMPHGRYTSDMEGRYDKMTRYYQLITPGNELFKL